MTGEFKGEVEFNEAWNVVNRLNDIQNNINNSFSNLKAFNSDKGDYNFNLVFQYLNSYMQELSQDITKKELEDARAMRNLIGEYMKKFPIINKSNNKVSIDNHALELTEKALTEYRFLLNDYKKIHGFGNPNKKDLNLSVTQM